VAASRLRPAERLTDCSGRVPEFSLSPQAIPIRCGRHGAAPVQTFAEQGLRGRIGTLWARGAGLVGQFSAQLEDWDDVLPQRPGKDALPGTKRGRARGRPTRKAILLQLVIASRQRIKPLRKGLDRIRKRQIGRHQLGDWRSRGATLSGRVVLKRVSEIDDGRAGIVADGQCHLRRAW
jgi:hypothetical protein